jgi:hypothetical protein
MQGLWELAHADDLIDSRTLVDVSGLPEQNRIIRKSGRRH